MKFLFFVTLFSIPIIISCADNTEAEENSVPEFLIRPIAGGAAPVYEPDYIQLVRDGENYDGSVDLSDINFSEEFIVFGFFGKNDNYCLGSSGISAYEEFESHVQIEVYVNSSPVGTCAGHTGSFFTAAIKATDKLVIFNTVVQNSE